MAAKTFDPQPVFMNVLPSPVEWAVEGRIPEVGVTCILGKPGSFKTFGTIDAACCMATGLNCWGQKVGPPRMVIYIAADAGRGAQLRIIAWITSHMDALKAAKIELVTDAQGRQSLPNLLLYPAAVNLHGLPLHGSAEVAAAIADIKAKGLKADVLCIDTLFHSSLGAKLTLPEELLPVLGELQKLMDALGVKTCLLVHHTTKEGEEYFGTVAFLATIEALIVFKAKPEDKTAVTVSCVRMREGDAFAPFEIKLQKVTVKTEPDKWERDQQETLAVIPGTAPAAQRPTKKEEELDFMEMVLAIHLRNCATAAQWLAKMIEVMPWKKNKKTGEMMPGISERTFYRNLAVIVERGHVILPTDPQGGTYSIVAGPWAGIQPGSVSGLGLVAPAETTANCHPYKGVAVSGSGFADGVHCQTTAKPLPNENGSGSSQDSEEVERTTSPAAEALRQTAELFRKAAKATGPVKMSPPTPTHDGAKKP
jgi:hypothetical protein